MQVIKENKDNDKKYRDSMDEGSGSNQYHLFGHGIDITKENLDNYIPYTPEGETEYFTE